MNMMICWSSPQLSHGRLIHSEHCFCFQTTGCWSGLEHTFPPAPGIKPPWRLKKAGVSSDGWEIDSSIEPTSQWLKLVFKLFFYKDRIVIMPPMLLDFALWHKSGSTKMAFEKAVALSEPTAVNNFTCRKGHLGAMHQLLIQTIA